VLDLWPNDLESREARAKFYDATGERDQAIGRLHEVIRLEPKKADLYRRANHACGKSDHDKAITDFTTPFAHPLNADAYCARGAVHGGRHNFKKAIADFTAAIASISGRERPPLTVDRHTPRKGDEIKAERISIGQRPGYGREIDRRASTQRALVCNNGKTVNATARRVAEAAADDESSPSVFCIR